MFKEKFLDLMITSLQNHYGGTENYDFELTKFTRSNKIKIFLENLFSSVLLILGKKDKTRILLWPKTNFYLDNLDNFKPLFDVLEDYGSQNKYVELLAFRAFGPTRVKLSLNNEAYWQGREEVNQCKRDKTISVKNFSRTLSLYDLNNYGYDLELFFVTNGIYVDFVLQQYNYNDLVCVEDGDVVIDAGGCWGDTALYFASRGAKDVYVYEFIPSNLEVFQKNIELNARYKDRIHIVDHPVWNKSGVALSYDDRGPASQVAEAGIFNGHTKTLSIDDLVLKHKLTSLDFIKMDIEGAEMPALKGAEESIKRFKPKLAISVYHKADDMIMIPKYILSLNPDYKLYLDYYTIVGHEIILYAIDRYAK